VTARDLDAIERLNWLRLARTPRIGPVTFARLIAEYETATAVIDALPELTKSRQTAKLAISSAEAAESELEQIERAGAHLFVSGEAGFPSALACIPGAPPVLIVKGRTELLRPAACAIVGSRNASAAGLRFARELACGISAEGIPIVSGLARGIDGAAHLGALDSGTIAVLAGGIDHVYPPEHRALHGDLAERGLLVSEMPLGATPTARDFPRRNRIISGLSRGTIIVEAAIRSGSLITARYAAEQGREVMAVPGSPIDPRAKGTNQLLRDGAHLIEGVEDVLAILAESSPPHRPIGLDDCASQADTFLLDVTVVATPDLADNSTPDAGCDAAATSDPVARLRNLLSATPVSADELARQSSLPVGIVQATLMEFELSGDAVILPGGLVQAG
jgi:DNA processing protein